MHRVLLISEILTTIFSSLAPECVQSDRLGLTSRGEHQQRRPGRAWTVALVCQAWKEPALDVFWKNIPSPLIVFDLLFKVDSNYGSSHNDATVSTPSPHAWRLFKRYSRRVRHLDFPKLSPSSVEVIQLYIAVRPLEDRNQPLFPSLLSLNAQCDDVVTRLLTLSFISPSLRALTLLSDLEATSGVEPLLNVCNLCPNLVDLVLNYPRESEGKAAAPFISSATQLLSGFKGLQSLALSSHLMVPSLLPLLSCIPTLTSLQWTGVSRPRIIRGGPHPIIPSSLWGMYRQGAKKGCRYGLFPSLKSLNGYASSMNEAVEVVSLVSSLPQLRNLIFEVGSAPQSTTTNILSFVILVAQHATTLRSLRLNFKETMIRTQDGFPFSQLGPLRACCDLTRLHIQVGKRVIWNTSPNTELVDLVQQFPCLVELVFFQDSGGVRLLTLECMEMLLFCCPELRSLGLTLDARKVPPFETTKYTKMQPPSTHLCSVEFPLSPVDETETLTIATFLLSLTTCPLSVGDYPVAKWDDRGMEYAGIWRKIGDLVKQDV